MARKAIEKIVNVKAMNFYWIGRAPIGYFMEKWTDRIKSPFGHKVISMQQFFFNSCPLKYCYFLFIFLDIYIQRANS